MEHDWITHRSPTEADGDEDGDVRTKSRPNSDRSTCIHWSCVGAGAQWRHTHCWVPPALKPVAPTTTPRKFVTLRRTIHAFGHTLDAIDEDGVAWWMVLGTDEGSSVSWTQLMPLPAREVPADA